MLSNSYIFESVFDDTLFYLPLCIISAVLVKTTARRETGRLLQCTRGLPVFDFVEPVYSKASEADEYNMSGHGSHNALHFPFLELPSEVQIQILECLRVPSQIACMLVSHDFYDIINHIRKRDTSNNPLKDRLWRRLIPMLWWKGGTGLLTKDPMSTWTHGQSGW